MAEKQPESRARRARDPDCSGYCGGFSIVCTGVALQKVPDRVFDRTATNLVYTLPAATIAEQ